MQDNKGFVQLNRRTILESDCFKNGSSNEFKLFIFCILRANYKTENCYGVELKEGEFITSIRHLSRDTGLSEQNVRTALKNLTLTHFLTQLSKRWKYTIIKVNDYKNFVGLTQFSTHKLTINNKDNKYNIVDFRNIDDRKEYEVCN